MLADPFHTYGYDLYLTPTTFEVEVYWFPYITSAELQL